MMRKRTFVKKGVCHLGKRKKGGFFPLAGPLLGAVAGPVLEKVAALMLTGVIGKMVGRGRRRRWRRRRRF